MKKKMGNRESERKGTENEQKKMITASIVCEKKNIKNKSDDDEDAEEEREREGTPVNM